MEDEESPSKKITFNPTNQFPGFSADKVKVRRIPRLTCGKPLLNLTLVLPAQSITTLFKQYNKSGNGNMHLDELKFMMEKLGHPQTHLGLKAMVEEVIYAITSVKSCVKCSRLCTLCPCR